MSEPQFNDEIGRLYHSQATKALLPVEPQSALNLARSEQIVAAIGAIKFSDVSVPMRRPLWKRALIWLRLMRPPAPQPSPVFKWTGACLVESGHDDISDWTASRYL